MLMHSQEKIEFVKRDFQYCWRHTLNRDNFDSNIYFEDPISKYTNYTGVFLRMAMTTALVSTSNELCLTQSYMQGL